MVKDEKEKGNQRNRLSKKMLFSKIQEFSSFLDEFFVFFVEISIEEDHLIIFYFMIGNQNFFYGNRLLKQLVEHFSWSFGLLFRGHLVS